MRIALYGGSFDPPHSGHIGIAMASVERLHLDRVLMAPVGRQPLKHDLQQSPFEDRMAMVQLACAGHPPVAASAIDAPRPDGRYNYTYDTLELLRQTLAPGDELFCLVGADSLQTLHQWHRVAEALMLAQWIVASRPGFPLEILESLRLTGIRSGLPEQGDGWLRIPIAGPPEAPGGNALSGTLWLLPGLNYEVSATELRAALADDSAGIPQRVLDPRVAEYAHEHGLYDRN